MRLQGAEPAAPADARSRSLDSLGELEAEVVRVTVTELRENTFYAQITIVHDGAEIEIDSRPSDAIALAIRARRRSSPRTT